MINLLLTKLARDHTGRISALGPYCQDLGPIFSQYGPRAWLISRGVATCTHGRTCVPKKMPKKGNSGFICSTCAQQKENIQKNISEFTGKNDRTLSLLINNSVTCYRFKLYILLSFRSSLIWFLEK